MANQMTNYKCPNCTGPLHFVGTSGKMECDYCGSNFTVEEIEKMNAASDAAAADAKASADQKKEAGDEWECASEQWTEKGMKAYNCPSCGAELILDENTAATSCPYCGNTTMVPGQFTGMLKPEFLIPFKLDKETAETKLKEYYKGKFLLPKAFTGGNHIEEIKGVYVPFWLYDGKAHAEGVYEGRNIDKHREGDYEVTVTEHYRAERAGDIAFEKIPADASTKMPDDLMDSIEPYDYKEMTAFSSAYLAGFMADKYDVTAEENAERAVGRAKESAKNAMKADVKNYDEVEAISETAEVKQGKVSYAMMPVWLLATKWNDRNFLFAMNGQTGRFVGELPMDKKKATITYIAVAALLAILIGAITVLTNQEADTILRIIELVIVPLGVAAIVLLILKNQLSNVAIASNASNYVTEGGMKFTLQRDEFTGRTEEREKVSSSDDKDHK